MVSWKGFSVWPPTARKIRPTYFTTLAYAPSQRSAWQRRTNLWREPTNLRTGSERLRGVGPPVVAQQMLWSSLALSLALHRCLLAEDTDEETANDVASMAWLFRNERGNRARGNHALARRYANVRLGIARTNLRRISRRARPRLCSLLYTGGITVVGSATE
jgi:hypothetical protein